MHTNTNSPALLQRHHQAVELAKAMTTVGMGMLEALGDVPHYGSPYKASSTTCSFPLCIASTPYRIPGDRVPSQTAIQKGLNVPGIKGFH